MASAVQKISLSASRDVPFNKLIISQANVRRIKAGVSIEELAEDIARRTMLQSLTVRPVRDAAGVETGMFEIPAGGRRYRALSLLVKQKRLSRTAPIPCIVRDAGIAEEDSLAENIQRAPLHPLDQFRAFLALREKGQSEEEIAAAFFVSVAVVKQRLRLAMVSPKLLDVYAEDGMTLDQLMAFTVNGDHARQEQTFDLLAQSYSKEPYTIRRMLTEGSVRASDKRAQFIGLDAYVEAGGAVLNDLFQSDDGGWLQDVGLVDMLVAEQLRDQAEIIQAEGWRWVETAPDFPYGHTYGLRRLRGEEVPLTDEEQAARDALQAEIDSLEETYAEANEVPDEVDQRLGEIETAIATFDERPVVYEPEEVGRAGAFISIDSGGHLRVERGFVRPEDDLPIEAPSPIEVRAGDVMGEETELSSTNDQTGAPAPEEDEGLKPLPDRLLTELTAYRTLALRNVLGGRPEIAFLAALHALCLKVFFRFASTDSCLELDLKSVGFAAQAPGLNDSPVAIAVGARHESWLAVLPSDAAELWDTLEGFETERRQALFAHCVSLSVNAMHEAFSPRQRAIAHADGLAATLDLDLVAAGWTPTVDNYFGRVTKARILEAVREARGDAAASRLEPLKKGDMAEQAQALLTGSGWLPHPLRSPGTSMGTAADEEIQGERLSPSTGEGELVDGLSVHQPTEEPPSAEHVAIAAE